MQVIMQPAVTGFVPASALVLVTQRIETINRKARKLGLEPVTFKVGEQRIVCNALRYGDNRPRTEVEVSIFGEQPRLAGGWKLLGVVDHREALPIVWNVPGHELPAGQRERGAVCDHCNAIRRRSDTFVLVDEAGTVKQVGRQCMGDFLGSTKTDPVAALNVWRTLFDVLSGEEIERHGSAPDVIEVRKVVKLAAALVRTYGWLSVTKAQMNNASSTADQVRVLDNPLSNAYARLSEDIKPNLTEELEREVDVMLEWARHSALTSDYMANLKALASCEYVRLDKVNLLASLPASFWRAEEREVVERAKLAARQSGYVGEVGKRVTMTLTLTAEPRRFDSAYTTFLHEFVDAQGFVFTWWGSSPATCVDLGWVVGEAREAKVTIKKHEEFRGFKRTVVTRVKGL